MYKKIGKEQEVDIKSTSICENVNIDDFSLFQTYFDRFDREYIMINGKRKYLDDMEQDEWFEA